MKTIITIEFESNTDLLNVLGEIRSEVQKGYTKSSGCLPAILQPRVVAPAPCAPMPPGYEQPPQHCYPNADEGLKEMDPTYYEYVIEK